MKVVICFLLASCVSAGALLPVFAETAGDAFSSGLKASQHNEFHEAIDRFDQAIQTDPNYLAAYEERATAQNELKRWGKGLSDAERAIVLGSTQAATFAAQASALYHLGRYEEAISASTKAINLKNAHVLPLAYSIRSKALAHLGRYQRALEDSHQAILLKPSDASLLSDQALICIDLEQYQRALDDCTKAIAIDPQGAIAFWVRAKVYRELGNKKLAAEDRDKAKHFGFKDDEPPIQKK